MLQLIVKGYVRHVYPLGSLPYKKDRVKKVGSVNASQGVQPQKGAFQVPCITTQYGMSSEPRVMVF